MIIGKVNEENNTPMIVGKNIPEYLKKQRSDLEIVSNYWYRIKFINYEGFNTPGKNFNDWSGVNDIEINDEKYKCALKVDHKKIILEVDLSPCDIKTIEWEPKQS